MQEIISLAANQYFAIYKPFLLLEFFTEESQDTVRDFVCYLCGGIYYDPKVDSCGHTFCNQCITSFLNNHDFCPVNGIKDFKLNTITSITKLVNRQSLFCKNKLKGCLFNGLITQYAEHKCDFELVKCENENCEFEIVRKDLIEHTIVCEFRKVKCEDCSKLIVFNRIQDHNNECLKKLIACDLNCPSMVIREEMKKHVIDFCDNTILTCQFSKDYQKHNYEGLQIHNSLFINYFEDFQNQYLEHRQILENKIVNLETFQKNEVKSPKHNSALKKKRNLDNHLEEELKNEEEDKKSNKTHDEEVILLNNTASIEEGLKQSHSGQNHMILFREATYGLQINENDITFSGKSSKPRIAFAYYTSKNASIFSWKIHIRKIINWVGLGVCSRENMEMNSFLLNKIGNFLFAITSDGKIYENKDPVQEHFSLKANDILDICFNSDLNTLLFKKEKLNITLYNVIPPKLGNILVPCVILNDKGDKISFI